MRPRGHFDPDGRRPIDADRLGWMTEALRHRGPDGGGTVLRPGPRARPPPARDHRPRQWRAADEQRGQPAAHRLNGEIYNFRELRDELRRPRPPLSDPLRYRGPAHGYAEWAPTSLSACAACLPSRSGTSGRKPPSRTGPPGREAALLCRDARRPPPVRFRARRRHRGPWDGPVARTRRQSPTTSLSATFRTRRASTKASVSWRRATTCFRRGDAISEARPLRYWRLRFGKPAG